MKMLDLSIVIGQFTRGYTGIPTKCHQYLWTNSCQVAIQVSITQWSWEEKDDKPYGKMISTMIDKSIFVENDV
jgi:hypothetical protein